MPRKKSSNAVPVAFAAHYLNVAGEGGHELHDRRLLAGEVAGVEVEGAVVELGEHAGAAVELLVGEAVLDPGVLVLTLEETEDAEEDGDRLAVDDLLARHEGPAASVREDGGREIESVALRDE